MVKINILRSQMISQMRCQDPDLKLLLLEKEDNNNPFKLHKEKVQRNLNHLPLIYIKILNNMKITEDLNSKN